MTNKDSRLKEEFRAIATVAGIPTAMLRTIEDCWQHMSGDPEVVSHQQRVAIIAGSLALDRAYEDAALFVAGSAVHDVGKTNIPGEYLYPERHNCPYDEFAQRVVRTHSRIGYQMLCETGFPELAVYAECHHSVQRSPYGHSPEEALHSLPGHLGSLYGLTEERFVERVHLLHTIDYFDAFETRRDSQHASLDRNDPAVLWNVLEEDGASRDDIKAIVSTAQHTPLLDATYSLAA